MLNGIDISAWQRGIDAASVPSDFVIVKATQGLDYINDDCDRAYQQAKAAGKKLGVYHFADGNSSGVAEADFFIDNIQGYIGEAILVLDWETDAVNCGPGYAKAFLDRVQARTGIKPMIYMSGSVVNEWDWSAVVVGIMAYGWLITVKTAVMATGRKRPCIRSIIGAMRRCSSTLPVDV